MKTKRARNMLRLKTIKRSHNPIKKYDAVFQKPNGSTKTTSFGQKGYNDFILYNLKSGANIANKHKQRYLARHSGMGEHWNDPTTAGSLARWVLWNKKTLKASISDYKRRFKMKGGSSPYKVIFYTGINANDPGSRIIDEFSEEEFLLIKPYILEAVQSEIAGVIEESVRIIHREDGDIYVSLNFADESERECNMPSMANPRGYGIGPILIEQLNLNIRSYRIEL